MVLWNLEEYLNQGVFCELSDVFIKHINTPF